MKLIETAVTETTVRMRYADSSDPTKAKHWIDFQVPLSELKMPSESALGDPERHFLATIRQVALRYARDVIGDETNRLANLRAEMRS